MEKGLPRLAQSPLELIRCALGELQFPYMTRTLRPTKSSEQSTPPVIADYRPSEYGEIPWLVKLAEREVGKKLDHELRGSGLTKSQFGVLQALVHLKKASSAALARTVFVSPQAMVGIIAGLERKAFVSRRASQPSARIIEATVTTNGKAALRKGEKGIRRVDDMISAEFSPDERAAFVSYLSRFVDTIRQDGTSR